MQLVVDGLPTNYEFLKSQNSKQYLVILPGWMRSSQEWLGVARYLSDYFNILILDFPGFGRTQKAPGDLDIYGYASFTRSFLKKLNISTYSILGHSFGGRVAILLASEGKEVEKLILVDSGGLNERDLLTSIKQKVVVFTKPVLKLLPIKLTQRIKNYMGSDDYRNSGDMRNTLVKILNQKLIDKLPKIRTPTLVVWGDRDKVLNVKESKVFADKIPDSKLRIVWGAGHSPFIDKPDKFLEILKEFLC